MRNVAWISIPVFVLLASADLSAQEEDDTADLRTDDKLYEWCMSSFPLEEGVSAKPLPRPAEKRRPFELADALTPPNLITRTEIVGTLPPEIEKYKGQWIWPAHDEAPVAAIFVERLTPSEMTIAWAFKREKDRDGTDSRYSRTVLKWTGKSFHYSAPIPRGFEELEAVISADGEAMLIMSGYTRTITLEDNAGNQSSHTSGEGWPFCFISDRSLSSE